MEVDNLKRAKRKKYYSRIAKIGFKNGFPNRQKFANRFKNQNWIWFSVDNLCFRCAVCLTLYDYNVLTSKKKGKQGKIRGGNWNPALVQYRFDRIGNTGNSYS